MQRFLSQNSELRETQFQIWRSSWPKYIFWDLRDSRLRGRKQGGKKHINYCSSHKDTKGKRIFSKYRPSPKKKKYLESKETDSNPDSVINYGDIDKLLDQFTSFSPIKQNSYVFGIDIGLHGRHPSNVLIIQKTFRKKKDAYRTQGKICEAQSIINVP